jgi:hypothetical protein
VNVTEPPLDGLGFGGALGVTVGEADGVGAGLPLALALGLELGLGVDPALWHEAEPLSVNVPTAGSKVQS